MANLTLKSGLTVLLMEVPPVGFLASEPAAHVKAPDTGLLRPHHVEAVPHPGLDVVLAVEKERVLQSTTDTLGRVDVTLATVLAAATGAATIVVALATAAATITILAAAAATILAVLLVATPTILAPGRLTTGAG